MEHTQSRTGCVSSANRTTDATEANVLCLCPTHAVGFGLGALVATDDGAVRDALSGAAVGGLRHVAGHRVDPANLAYHRGMFLPRG